MNKNPRRTPATTTPTTPEASPTAPVAAPRLGFRLALWGVLAVVLVHSAAVALYVAPNNMLEQTIGSKKLANYISPVWGQGWSVFAPIADGATDMLEFRAQVRTPAGTTTTPWTEFTAREVVPAVRHNPFPSRAMIVSMRLSGYVTQRYGRLSTRQKQVIVDAGTTIDNAALLQRLRDAATTPVERAAAESYLRGADAVEGFVSGVALSLWGEDVVAISYRHNQRVATQYSAGTGKRVVTSGYNLTSTWRPVHPVTKAERDTLGDYARQYGIGAGS